MVLSSNMLFSSPCSYLILPTVVFYLPLQGLLVIDDLLLHLLNGFGIAMRDKKAVEMHEVFACGFTLHSQVAVAEVVIRGSLNLVASHGEEPTANHD